MSHKSPSPSSEKNAKDTRFKLVFTLAAIGLAAGYIGWDIRQDRQTRQQAGCDAAERAARTSLDQAFAATSPSGIVGYNDTNGGLRAFAQGNGGVLCPFNYVPPRPQPEKAALKALNRPE